MKSYLFRKLDAFTTGASPGNPAGCVLLNSPDDISAEDMQRIAFELGSFVSEVGYVWPTPAKDWAYELRYFSREREVNFCGHATVAIMYDLLRRREKTSHNDVVKIKTPAGILEVEDRILDNNLVFIDAPEPQFLEIKPSLIDVAKALNLTEDKLNKVYPVACINAGLNTLVVAVKTLSGCVECRPDYETLRRFCFDHGIEVITIYTSDTAFNDYGVRTRVFAPLFGYLEDPATGSGNAALGYFLASRGDWPEDTMKIEQGISRDKPNIVILKKAGARLKIGGQSICRIEGKYFLT
jgi:PhzF family phenazine biosynthesis protein